MLQATFFALKFVGIVFIETVFAGSGFVSSIISLHVITESPILLSKYLSFSQVHLRRFEMSFLHTCFLGFSHSNQHLSLFHFDLNYIWYHQIYIYISIIHMLLMFLIYLFLLSFLSDGSSRLLQPSLQLSELTING